MAILADKRFVPAVKGTSLMGKLSEMKLFDVSGTSCYLEVFIWCYRFSLRHYKILLFELPVESSSWLLSFV